MIINDIPLTVLKDQLAKNIPLAIVTTESVIERLESLGMTLDRTRRQRDSYMEKLNETEKERDEWRGKYDEAATSLADSEDVIERASTLFGDVIIDHGNGITEDVNATIRATLGQGNVRKPKTPLNEEALEKAALAMCRYVVANREFSQGISPAYHQTQSAKAAVTAYLSALPAPAVTEVVEELTEAIRFTVEYIGTEYLPPIEGWSWYEALKKYAPAKLEAFKDSYRGGKK